MFTGIIEALGKVQSVEPMGSGLAFWLSCPFVQELSVDESVSHDGVCLTVAERTTTGYKVVAVQETLQRTSLGSWQPGQLVNLERSMPAGGRFHGHMVQGHVDAAGNLEKILDQNGSWLLTFKYPAAYASLLVEKGSCCLHGISLTVFNLVADTFQVAIIPYTWQHTSLSTLQAGAVINLEFDVVGKYLHRKWSLENN